VDAPPVFDELDRQVVEQLRVNRRLALPSEVVQALRQADAEEQVPEAIDKHASGESAGPGLRVSEPVGQVEPGGPPVATDLAEELPDRRLHALPPPLHP